MRISRLDLASISVAILLLAGCGDDTLPSDGGTGDAAERSGVTLPPPDGDTSSMSIDGSWILTSGDLAGEPLDLVPGWDLTLTITGDQVSGTAACNGYGGALTVDDRLASGGQLRVTDLSWTEMGCAADVMRLEQRFLEALQTVDSFELATTLTLGETGAATSLSFDPLAPIPNTEVVGTNWLLDTVIEGDAVSNSPGMSAATLTLNDDRTLTGSTGCRMLEGEWIGAGAEIVFTSFSAIDDPLAGVCAPESEALDGFIIGVLEGGFTVEIDGPRLTLMAQGNEGLSYTSG